VGGIAFGDRSDDLFSFVERIAQGDPSKIRRLDSIGESGLPARHG
jgi:hypothetical protein